MALECPNCHHVNPRNTHFCGNCATPLPLPAELLNRQTRTLVDRDEELTTGSTFASRYTIIEELGRGGMGNVYKANDIELGEKVALKLIKSKIASDHRTIERFRNELKLARRIRHKNVCQMFDLNKEGDRYFITMEYVSGEDLKSFIRRSRQLSVKTAVSIARQVCEGLIEAHKHGIIHRDLKPSNIMIDREGNVRIMDFGIARLLKSKCLTGSGILLGTPEYMSPEQVDGDKVDSRADIYSLGVILYEIVSGQLPFVGETPLSIALKQKQETPADPRTLNPDTPTGLSRVILKCLEKNREQRYSSAAALLADLEQVDMTVPSTERELPKKKATGSKEITVSFSLKKLLLPALALVVVLAGVFLAWKLSSRGNAVSFVSDKPSLGVLYFENYSGDPTLDYMRRAFSELMITDLSDSLHIRILRLDEITGILQVLHLDQAQAYSLEDIQQVGRRGGIDHIIRGSFIKTGENFRITTTLIDTSTGETIFSLSAQAEGQQDLSQRVDELAGEIRARIDIAPEQLAVQEAIGVLEPPAVPQKK